MFLACAPSCFCNSLIYGDALGTPARSVQLPRLIDEARESGTSYMLALERAPAGLFAFVENGEPTFRDMARVIGRALALGDAQSMTSEAAQARWGRSTAIFSLGSKLDAATHVCRRLDHHVCGDYPRLSWRLCTGTVRLRSPAACHSTTACPYCVTGIGRMSWRAFQMEARDAQVVAPKANRPPGGAGPL